MAGLELGRLPSWGRAGWGQKQLSLARLCLGADSNNGDLGQLEAGTEFLQGLWS